MNAGCRSHAGLGKCDCRALNRGKATHIRMGTSRCTALVEDAVAAPSGIEAIRKTDELSDTVGLEHFVLNYGSPIVTLLW